MINQRLYADVHILQSIPPANVNRDDAGSPKTAIYGGARRSRVSSQAWKRATRMAFASRQGEDLRGIRTRHLHDLLTERLTVGAGLSFELASRVGGLLIKGLGLKPGKRDGELAYLLFFGIQQIDGLVARVRALELDDALADAELKEILESERLEEALASGHPVDVALFGRMVADVPRINVDAAVQVAHAISTHAVEGEFDYFTAVDDMNTSDETGAGMIGAIEFNSACLYRFASVGMHLLAENLSGSWDAAAAALELFLDGFALSMPSGYENSFAQKTRPALVAIVLREDQPVNLVSAFEAPVTGEEGVVDESIARLARALMDEERRWGDAPVMAAATWAEGSVTQRVDEVLREALGENLTFAELHVELRAGLSGLRV